MFPPAWMLDAPASELSPEWEAGFRLALARRDPAYLPPGAPVWVFLQWLAGQGLLLHGSRHGDLRELRPREDPVYGQPDDFSNRVGVYAASDGLWAMMYALRGPGAAGQSDMALRLRLPGGDWTDIQYFYALGHPAGAPAQARDLMGPGFVYVLSPEGFEPSPPYAHPGLGFVQEAHAVCPHPVRPLMAVPVGPEDFPLPVRTFDQGVLRERARLEPWGFPWLSANAEEAK